MDSLKSTLGAYDDLTGYDAEDDEVDSEALPPGIEGSERRMQVRAYNFWASLLENRNYPNVEDLNPAALPDFGPHGVLLDFTDGIEDPAIAYLGEKLAEECGANGRAIETLADVPARSLLTRITDHYMQIIASQTPIGFEAEFVNQRGLTILYRGILMPFSSDDMTIDYIYGVINWKELADARAADELLLEIDQALDRQDTPAQELPDDISFGDRADGPQTDAIPQREPAASPPGPSIHFDLATHYEEPDSAPQVAGIPAAPAINLPELLNAAREMAANASAQEERTRVALYDAIARAYDFALATAEAPGEFAAMLEQAGIAVQERAPMTPVVKLVFGADYDKTRLTEYATALAHAMRLGLERGTLGDYLRSAKGGLKGVVASERAHRREEAGQTARPRPAGPRGRMAKKLRAMEPVDLGTIAPEGSEFSLVMIRRTAEGKVVVLGEVPEDGALVKKAAGRLLG